MLQFGSLTRDLDCKATYKAITGVERITPWPMMLAPFSDRVRILHPSAMDGVDLLHIQEPSGREEALHRLWSQLADCGYGQNGFVK